MIKQTIITIDPGSSGGIAYFVNNKIHAVKMPKSVPEMNEFFQYLKSNFENPIVFIEKVQAYGKEDDAPGKKFAINKMLANYEQILTVIKLTPFVYVEVYPVT